MSQVQFPPSVIYNALMEFHKNHTFTNPLTDTPVFGIVPEINHSRYHFPQGEIVLKYGGHWGRHGYGVKHILEQHSRELTLAGYEDVEGAVRFVSDILKGGSRIYCEFSRMKEERMTVLQGLTGSVIIEHKYDGDNQTYYSVVTAFDNKRAKGQLIGNIM